MAATTTTPPPGQNIISGKVLLKETGAGIPDLLVVLYDYDPGTTPDESFTPTVTTALGTGLADRLGSVLTESDGTWALAFEHVDFQALNPTEKRPDLHLVVLAPEDSDSDKPPTVLFSSKLLRANSGKTEAYIVRLTEKQLTDAKIPVPQANSADTPVSGKLNAYLAKRNDQRALRDGIKNINAAYSAADKTYTTDLRNTIKEAILPNASILNNLPNFVKDKETIQEVQVRVYTSGSNDIDTRLNNIDTTQPEPAKGMKINLFLTDTEKNNLSPYRFTHKGKTYYNIPEQEIQLLLFKRENNDGINTILFSNNPVSKYCIQKSADEKCAEVHTGIKPPDTGTPPNPVTPVPPTGISSTDIPFYLEKVLQGKDSDQFQNTGNTVGNRPNGESVQASVNAFSLQKGPADTTAFYDFHSLQIAFQHVWQQLLDETLVDLGEKIHTEQENNGQLGIVQSLKDRGTVNGTTVLMGISEAALRNLAQEVPAEVAAAFDISFLEYDALSSASKTKLEQLAREINLLETNPPRQNITVQWPLSGTVTIPSNGPDPATRALVLREQGERIIDHIRINKPYSTNQLLRELQERLLSKYEFTVFAANKDYHSVNFGLMNTFRQKWEPVSYQAGKLVKTIPLSPKEERKYSVKTTQQIKTTRKQAQKNNASLNQEMNTTSRAEAEIVAKAHDKSNFNMSVKLDFSKISSEVSFGKEAEKESAQTKKDFREAVIKAAQEFKEERSIEIDTEETASSEYNESGTIVNPNDELSVTYLFYELQRRYRVSEQLYRVMPVVMVAQEVPAPHQITEAWIVAHDWVLNRALLDDSFRPTLQYLAQKNVGDDFAIRELRKNLRQQRTLVTQLQLEFSKLKKQVDNKYSALQNRIGSRINEEHDKRFYKWWWWWGRENRPNDPPDPEMAKAMEQAAADDHKHAVEQAEQMAMTLQREVNQLHQLTTDYNATMREHLDRITQTRRLVTHVKENILYYMQAVWSMEPPDQRFMRLYKVQVPYFEATRTCIVEDTPAEDFFAHFREAGKQKYNAWLHAKVDRNPDGTPAVTYKQLVEVADLDTPLGFKGNYMIFPLKEHNALTELMAAPYIDEAFGAMDPDELSNINLTEFSRYICCLHKEDPLEYERLKPVLRYWLEKLLADPLRNGDEIIVPTGSLFIEMLPSDKSLLEDFKLKHREWDVYKVQAEVRRMELENIRYAARLLNAEREDPDVEKKIIVNGVNTNLGITDAL